MAPEFCMCKVCSIKCEYTINCFVIYLHPSHSAGTKVGCDTALAQIIKLVEDAQCSKGETQKLADTISGYFVPVVVFLSLMTFLIWDILGGVGIVCIE